jgi:CheY-like chemotaxis protein
MNGTITVESEYGKGSEFKVVLPQGVSSEEPFAEVLEPEKKKILVYEGRAVYARSLCWSLENLGVPYVMVETLDKFSAALPREEWHYVFSGYGLYEKIKPLMARTDFPGGKKPPLALMVEWENEANITGVRFISLPILSLSIANMLNGNEDSRPYFNAQSSSLIRFTYPGARLLVVDDISSNLKVAEGLLAPYQAKLVSCLSGARAIDLVKQHEYDIVFMDHMMPEMDGLEATAAIRAWEEERNKTTPRPEAGAAARRARVPIIALTANAVSGMREMFLENGFDDFLAKPIDISKLDEILHRWIPREKMGVASGERESEAENMGISHFPQIPGLDIPRGISMTGGRIAPYRQALSAFVRDAQKRLPLLQNAPQAANLPGFVTQVHALKSAAASLGAAETSARAAELEAAGSAADFDFIRENLPLFAERLAELIGGIEAWESAAPEQDAPGGERDQAAVTRLWPELAAALKAENAGDIDRLLEELMRRTSDTRTKEALEKISANVLLAEFDRAAEIVRSLL